jgi:AcrR family transcriptional regulator
MMGTRDRRERERQETRARILDAAREMFATLGIEATTMRAIAERIEYTPTAIYHHFRDKDELIFELCHADFQALAQRFARIGRLDDPIERIRRSGLAYAEFGLQNPHHYQIMFMTRTPPHAHLHEEEHGNPDSDAYAFLRQAVDEGMQQNRFRPEFRHPDELAQILWAGVHGVVSLHIAKGNDAWVEWCDVQLLAEGMVDSLIRGVLRS